MLTKKSENKINIENTKIQLKNIGTPFYDKILRIETKIEDLKILSFFHHCYYLRQDPTWEADWPWTHAHSPAVASRALESQACNAPPSCFTSLIIQLRLCFLSTTVYSLSPWEDPGVHLTPCGDLCWERVYLATLPVSLTRLPLLLVALPYWYSHSEPGETKFWLPNPRQTYLGSLSPAFLAHSIVLPSSSSKEAIHPMPAQSRADIGTVIMGWQSRKQWL